MNKEFIQLNEQFNDETYPIFPFVSKNRITPLQKGKYRKHKANFRGVTAVFNTEAQEYEYLLYGMYVIKEDIIIVPPEVEMNDNKLAFLNAHLKAGYKQVDSAPKFETFKFPPDSYEAKLALANKVEHQYSKTPTD